MTGGIEAGQCGATLFGHLPDNVNLNRRRR